MDYDVLIVGAGISGIDAAYRLQTRCPAKTYAILEARDAVGGTWDLFKYPGLRSDADLFQFSFPFEPWRSEKSIADGAAILDYIKETAAKYRIDTRIKFDSKVVSSDWSGVESRWTVRVAHRDGSTEEHRARFVYFCSGYYSYDSGYLPEFAGIDTFRGEVVHPQEWPEGLDYGGKRVVVIGSGATAITLLPALAKEAEKVTMLQRTPGYLMSMADRDPIADQLRKLLPEKLAHSLARWKNVLIALAVFHLFRRLPGLAKKTLIQGVTKKLPDGYRVDTHFTPPYNVFDQRMLLVPNGDLFAAISAGQAEVVTGHIDRFIESGVLLKSGEKLKADIIVTATGLRLVFAGQARVTVDGEPVELPDRFVYRGQMLDGLPNFSFCVGYTNAPWTLRADQAAKYLCRLLNHMDRDGFEVATPRLPGRPQRRRPLLALESGYIKRAKNVLPSQGTGAWYKRQNYFIDLIETRFGDIGQDMVFAPAAEHDRLG
ncbi:MAG TPA: NAD(P)/FAD-dependent oxidoreductase [Streptosporangiaceae bacterium]|nr:NAD(P)/FAD-dependent oxidoreductase [Streptosporangiaceae bacterium]